jgi:hypothetical protein
MPSVTFADRTTGISHLRNHRIATSFHRQQRQWRMAGGKPLR